MITILDIAKQEADAMAKESIAVTSKTAKLEDVRGYFLKKQFKHLYRRYMMNTVGRRITDRECDIALEQAIEEQSDG